VRLDGLYPFSYKSDLDGMGLYSYKSAEEDAIARYFSRTTNVSGSDVISHIGDTSRPPQIGRSYDFDGTNHTQINLTTTGFQSFSFWVYLPTDTDSTSGLNLAIGINNLYNFIGFGASTGSLTNEVITLSVEPGRRYGVASITLLAGWHHIAAVWTGSNYTFYVNGAVQTTINSGTPQIEEISRLMLGTRGDSALHFTGKLFDARFWASSLTAQEILDVKAFKTVKVEDIIVGDKGDNVGLSACYDTLGLTGTKSSWSISNNYEGDDVPYSFQNRKGYSKGLIKSTADSWGTGGVLVSTNEFSGDFTFSFKGLETVYYRYIGISDAALSGLGNTSIDYAFYLQNAGVADVRESGTLRTSTFAYTKDSIFRIQRNGSTITYYHNDTLIYTSLVAFASPIKIDIAVYSQNCTIAPCLIDGAKVELADNVNFTTEFFPLSGSGLDVLNYSADNKGQVSYTANVVSGTFADQSAGFAETDTAVVDLNQYEAPATRGLPNNFVATDTPTSLNIDNMFITRNSNIIIDLEITDPDIVLTDAKVQAKKDAAEATAGNTFEYNTTTYTTVT
jgi:hypothetical protein